jgi:hypothetical protein
MTGPDRRRVVAVGAVAVVMAGSVAALRGNDVLSRLTGDSARRAERADALKAAATTLDWPDLVPPASDGPRVRRMDGSAPRGIIEHGEVVVQSPTSVPGKPGLDRAELVRRLGGTGNLDGPARRVSDGIGGLGSMKGLQPRGGESRADLDGRIVRLSGFVAPLLFDAADLTEFLLVPYVGACVHVPPPPANQVVHVSRVHGFRLADGQLRPIWITGRIVAGAADTALARAGYLMEDPEIDAYL